MTTVAWLKANTSSRAYMMVPVPFNKKCQKRKPSHRLLVLQTLPNNCLNSWAAPTSTALINSAAKCSRSRCKYKIVASWGSAAGIKTIVRVKIVEAVIARIFNGGEKDCTMLGAHPYIVQHSDHPPQAKEEAHKKPDKKFLDPEVCRRNTRQFDQFTAVTVSLFPGIVPMACNASKVRYRGNARKQGLYSYSHISKLLNLPGGVRSRGQ